MVQVLLIEIEVEDDTACDAEDDLGEELFDIGEEFQCQRRQLPSTERAE